MSYGVAVNTQIAGAAEGEFKDDLTTIGKWPRPNAIHRITKITINKGKVIDSVQITYETSNGLQTSTHGGKGGDGATSFDLNKYQTITAVYGRRLDKPNPYGTKSIVQLSFVVVTADPSVSGKPTSAVQNFDTEYLTDPNRTNTQFQFTWPLVAATSYSSKPDNQPNLYLQGIGFTELFAQAGGTL